MSIAWTSEARRSLRAIRRYIAQDSEFYAARMAARIIERVEVTALMPTRGHAVHEFPERPLKEVHEGNYRIIYEWDDEEFRVLTIVHFREQLEEKRLTRRYRQPGSRTPQSEKSIQSARTQPGV